MSQSIDASLESVLDNASLNLGDNFLEGEKIVFKFNSFFALDFVLRQEEISHDSLGGVDRILGKEGGLESSDVENFVFSCSFSCPQGRLVPKQGLLNNFFTCGCA